VRLGAPSVQKSILLIIPLFCAPWRTFCSEEHFAHYSFVLCALAHLLFRRAFCSLFLCFVRLGAPSVQKSILLIIPLFCAPWRTFCSEEHFAHYTTFLCNVH